MKRIFVLASLILLSQACQKNRKHTDDPQAPCMNYFYKYYQGKKDTLGVVSADYIITGLAEGATKSSVRSFIGSKPYIDNSYVYDIVETTSTPGKGRAVFLRLKSSASCDGLESIIADLEKSPLLSFANPTIQAPDCNSWIEFQTLGKKCVAYYGATFYVRVKDKNNLSDLNKMASNTGTKVVKSNEFMPDVFELYADKNSRGDALAMANYFQESGLFVWAEPAIGKYGVEK